MNRTERILRRTGYATDRSGMHILQFEVDKRPTKIKGQKLTREQFAFREELKELNKEASTFPSPQTLH